jgi:hypothetical protein
MKSVIFIGFALFFTVSTTWALYFRLEGDRLWLQADNTPLVEILEQFVRTGVEVRVDPRIQSNISGSVRGMALDHALEDLLEPYDYLVTWKILGGPLGSVPKLQEIRLFLPGSETAAKPIPRKSPVFEATRGVLGSAPEFVKDELLVTVRRGTTYNQFKRLLDEIGGMIVDADAATGVYLIRFPPGTNVEALLIQLTPNPLVAHVELNYVTRLPPGEAVGSTELISPPAARRPADGSIPIAVLDSGFDPGASPAGILSAGWDAVDPDRSLSDPGGHGTQMAFLASGLLSPDGFSGQGQILPVVAVRTFDEEGKTSNFAILQAITYAANAGAKVVNMSWGSETDSEFMRRAMQTAARKGLLLVAAAGNSPTGKPVYPAAYPTVIAVGGVTPDGQPWAGSNFGNFVEVSAPALARFPVGHNGPPGAYVGTSISSATVANALAQYLNQHPQATTASAVAALKKSLSPPPSGGYGSGILDSAAWQRFLQP